MKVTVLGRLHFHVSSQSRADVVHLVDLEPQDGHPYFCSCERFTKHTDYHGQPCDHIAAAVLYVQQKLTP